MWFWINLIDLTLKMAAQIQIGRRQVKIKVNFVRVFTYEYVCRTQNDDTNNWCSFVHDYIIYVYKMMHIETCRF